MPPTHRLPRCAECNEEAYEELQPEDGSVHVVATHKRECSLLPFAPISVDPRATKIVVRYDRAKAQSACLKL